MRTVSSSTSKEPLRAAATTTAAEGSREKARGAVGEVDGGEDLGLVDEDDRVDVAPGEVVGALGDRAFGGSHRVGPPS